MIRAVAFDLDGVVYEGERIIEGVADTIAGLTEEGIDIFYVTNNSGKKRASIASKLRNMGIESSVEHIVTSSYAAAVLARSLSPAEEARILVIGSDEMEEEIAQLNKSVVHELHADFLIVGFDRAFNYDRLALGLNALRQGAAFIACNRDRVFPLGDGQVLPACGPIVAALEWAWGKKADYVVGKPNKMMLELAVQKRGFRPDEILVVGDSVESDIAMAAQFGCPSALIVRGDQANTVMEEMPSNYVINSVEQVVSIIHERR
jgi:arabinose operon protein AraL